VTSTKKRTLDPKTEFLLSFAEVLLETALLAYEKDPTLDALLAYEKDPTLDALERAHLKECIERLEDTLQAVKFPDGRESLFS